MNGHKNSINMRRFTTHPLYIAIKNDGFNSFDISVLATTMCIEKAGMYEQKYITKLNCRKPHGYNVREGGVRGFADGPRSEAFKAACKVRAKKQFSDPFQRERIRRQLRAFWADPNRLAVEKARRKKAYAERPELREISLANLKKAHAAPRLIKNGWKMPPAFGRKITERNLANRDVLSARAKAKWQDPEYRALAIANGTKGKTGLKRSEEFKRAMKERLAKQWADPEFKARRVAILLEGQRRARAERRGQKVTAESRLKSSTAHKKLWADQAYREKMLLIHKDPKKVEKARQKSLEQWKDPLSRGILVIRAKQRMQDPKMRAAALRGLDLGRRNRGKKSKAASAEQSNV